MKSIKAQRLDFLNETVKYYSEDTSRRAVRSTRFCMYYDATTGNKCAIGRHIKLQDYLANNLDEGYTANEYYVFALLPEHIRRLGKSFLRAVQILHDNRHYWLTNKLSEKGKEKVETIVHNYCI